MEQITVTLISLQTMKSDKVCKLVTVFPHLSFILSDSRNINCCELGLVSFLSQLSMRYLSEVVLFYYDRFKGVLKLAHVPTVIC